MIVPIQCHLAAQVAHRSPKVTDAGLEEGGMIRASRHEQGKDSSDDDADCPENNQGKSGIADAGVNRSGEVAQPNEK